MTQYPLRVPDHVMEHAKRAADEERVPVDEMLVAFIVEGLDHREGLKMMRKRAARADEQATLALLDKVPNVPADVDDALPELTSYWPSRPR